MQKWLHHLITVFAVGAAIQGTAQQAIAQTFLDTGDIQYPEHPHDIIMRGFYGELGDTDRSFDTLKILGEYFGFSYPELEGKRDMKKLDILYRDLLYQQTASDPVILTPDLANPYNSSLHQEAVLNPSFSAP